MEIFTKIIIALTITFTAITSINAQQNPPFQNWKYIDAGHYRIIFPEGLEAAAQRIANLMAYYEKYNYAGMSTGPEYVPIVIINDYCAANGFVSSAPFYSHWFTTPSSFASADWFTGLAIHEGRHIVQRNRLREGPGKFAWSVPFGNYGTAVFQGLYIPVWFLEGDAVVMETALTWGGRGRIASFPLWYRALELNDKRYSYYRAYLGTNDDMYPYANPYSLGYLICSYVRRHYGREAWDSILDDTGRFCLFPTFDGAIKAETNKSIREIYNETMDEYREYWKNNLAGMKFTKSENISPERESTWESWVFPFTVDGNIYAMRFARDRKLALVKIDNNGAEEIRLMPYNALSPLYKHQGGLSAGGDFALWRETVPDPRWGYRSYSELRLYSFSSGQTFNLTSKGKFIASAISSDGSAAAGIEYRAETGYSLITFSTETKERLVIHEINGFGHVFDPAVADDGTIALCSLDKNGNAVLVMDMKSGKSTTVAGYTHNEHFRTPVFYDRYLFYISDYTGVDNIYAIDLKTKERFQVTSVMLGAYYPHVSRKNKTLLFNEYTLTGYKTVSIRIAPETWRPFAKLERPVDPYIETISSQELGKEGKVPDDVPEKKYKAKGYHTLLHGMMIPGWYPFFDVNNNDFSFNIITQDVLHTVQALVSYIFNLNEKTHTGKGTLIYAGLYPVFSFSGSFGNRALYIEEEKNRYNGNDYVTWMEKSAVLGISIPLNFSRGINSTFLSFGATGGMVNITDVDPPVYSIYSDLDRNGLLKYASYHISFQHTITGALNSRIPRWGELINLSYSHTPWKADYTGKMFSADMTIYLPSVFSTHGFKLTGGYTCNDKTDYVFTQPLLFPRGYESVVHEKFISGSADYLFPIADFSLPVWKLIHFRRMNGTVFFDYGRGISGDSATAYPSTGFELTLVQNLLSNSYLVFEAGLRVSYCFATKEKVYGLVLTTPLLE